MALDQSNTLRCRRDAVSFSNGMGSVHDTFDQLRGRLEAAGIHYVVIGAIGMDGLGYARPTTDIDICVRPADFRRFEAELVGSAYERVPGTQRRFRDPASDVTFDLFPSGELAGRVPRNKEIRFPDPDEAAAIRGVPTVSLERMIELKLVTWRTKDSADVIELMGRNNLGEEFAYRLHTTIQMAYWECYDKRRDEDRHEREA